MIPFTTGSRVGHDVEPDGCWRFSGAIAPQGYGRIGIRGQDRTGQAHRVYWERANGPVPKGFDLDHLCRHRYCVNPAHLEVVTRQENSWRGAKSLLNWKQVRAIRALYARGGVSEYGIAAAYGVSRGAIHGLLAGRRWVEL